jgi:tRNA A37 threonylcarbamoyladenosine biosynthesis protein TsaE
MHEQLVLLPVLPVAPATIAASALQATGCGTAKQLVTRLAKLLAAAQEHLPSLATCQLAASLAGAGRYSTTSLSGEPAAAVDLRPVAALVAAARHQRALFGPLPEEEVLVSAALLVVLPLLRQQDLPAFDDLMAHAFPAAPEQELETAVQQAKAELDEATGVLEQALDAVIPRLHLQLSNAQKAKAVQLDDALQAAGSSPVLLTGSPCSGKTTVVRLLSAALQARPASGVQPAPAVTLTTLHPAALPVEKLLGSCSGDVGWEDGALAAAVRAAIQAQCSGQQRVETCKQQPQHWLHIRGPAQGAWTDALQPLMAPEGAHLQLGSGEVLLLPANTRVILEVPAEVPCAQPVGLEAAGCAGSLPAALSVWCSSSICCQPGLLSWKEMLLPAWLAELPAALLPGDVLRPALLELLDQLLPPCLAAACAGDGIPAVPEAQLALRMLQVLHALLQSNAAAPPAQALSQASVPDSVPDSSGLHPRKHLLVAGRLMSEQMQLLQAAVVTAVTWGLGGHLDEAARKVLDARLRPVLAQAVVAEHPLSTPPEARSLFDYVFDPAAMKWVAWAELVAPAVAAAMQSQAAGRKAGSTSEEVPELQVPTEEQLRCGWLLQLLQQAGVAVGLVGPAGAGKSALLRHLVQRQQQQQEQSARASRPVCYSHSGSGTVEGLKQALAGHSSSAAAGGCGLLVVDGLHADMEVRLAHHHLTVNNGHAVMHGLDPAAPDCSDNLHQKCCFDPVHCGA